MDHSTDFIIKLLSAPLLATIDSFTLAYQSTSAFVKDIPMA
jgi:hypothetical protein